MLLNCQTSSSCPADDGTEYCTNLQHWSEIVLLKQKYLLKYRLWIGNSCNLT